MADKGASPSTVGGVAVGCGGKGRCAEAYTTLEDGEFTIAGDVAARNGALAGDVGDKGGYNRGVTAQGGEDAGFAVGYARCVAGIGTEVVGGSVWVLDVCKRFHRR